MTTRYRVVCADGQVYGAYPNLKAAITFQEALDPNCAWCDGPHRIEQAHTVWIEVDLAAASTEGDEG